MTDTDTFTKRVGILPGQVNWTGEEWALPLLQYWWVLLVDTEQAWKWARMRIARRTSAKIISSLGPHAQDTENSKELYITALESTWLGKRIDHDQRLRDTTR